MRKQNQPITNLDSAIIREAKTISTDSGKPGEFLMRSTKTEANVFLVISIICFGLTVLFAYADRETPMWIMPAIATAISLFLMLYVMTKRITVSDEFITFTVFGFIRRKIKWGRVYLYRLKLIRSGGSELFLRDRICVAFNRTTARRLVLYVRHGLPFVVESNMSGFDKLKKIISNKKIPRKKKK